jgi:hypothetical protein
MKLFLGQMRRKYVNSTPYHSFLNLMIKLGEKIVVNARDQEGEVIVSFEDAGIGISLVHLQKVFEEFFQVKRGMKDKTPGERVLREPGRLRQGEALIVPLRFYFPPPDGNSR